MHKFAKILPESECGSRLRMVRWYYQTRFENGLMQKKADCGSRKSGSSQDCGIKKRKGGWKRSETGGKNGNEQSNGSNGWYEYGKKCVTNNRAYGAVLCGRRRACRSMCGSRGSAQGNFGAFDAGPAGAWRKCVERNSDVGARRGWGRYERNRSGGRIGVRKLLPESGYELFPLGQRAVRVGKEGEKSDAALKLQLPGRKDRRWADLLGDRLAADNAAVSLCEGTNFCRLLRRQHTGSADRRAVPHGTGGTAGIW